LTGDGKVYAFGNNFRGQLGTVLKYEEWGGVTHMPTRLILPTASMIAAGSSHSLVLTSQGIYGTGSNIYGQLADPTVAGWLKHILCSTSLKEPEKLTGTTPGRRISES
jgi:alpha-tubulin suppressor-like RCC1 family protein